jgi:hypothetical protein
LIDGKKKSIHFGSNFSKIFVDGAYIEGAYIQKRHYYSKKHSVNENWNEINLVLYQRVYYGVIVMILKKI